MVVEGRDNQRGVGSQFARFCIVGVIGFFIDAVSLEAVLLAGFQHPLLGRLLSFANAGFVTFNLNRRWSFLGTRREPYWTTFGSYLGVQSLGFFCNLSIYTACYLILPPPLSHPLVCLVTASACALAINFHGVRYLVFRAVRTAD